MNKTEITELKDKILFEVDYVIHIFDDVINTIKYLTEFKYDRTINSFNKVDKELKKCFSDYEYNIFFLICVYMFRIGDLNCKSLDTYIDIYKYIIYHTNEEDYDKLKYRVLKGFIHYFGGYNDYYFTEIYNPEFKEKLQEYIKFIYQLDFIKQENPYIIQIKKKLYNIT